MRYVKITVPNSVKVLQLSVLLYVSTILFFGLSSGQCFALGSDREQDINIQADAAVIDDSKGVTTYSGNVTIDQGTLHIAADVVRVIMQGQEILQIIANMEPESTQYAHYEQMSDDDDRLVSADAKIITYLLQEERLHLAGGAVLKQTRDTFSGELIHYDLAKGIVDLKGGSSRVNITLTPKRK